MIVTVNVTVTDFLVVVVAIILSVFVIVHIHYRGRWRVSGHKGALAVGVIIDVGAAIVMIWSKSLNNMYRHKGNDSKNISNLWKTSRT